MLISFFVMTLYGCNEVNEENQVNVYTHAITGLYNPQSYFIDNTKEGFEYAISFEGLQGIEMDVQFSRDSTIWMFHDEYLDDRTSGSGRIYERGDDYLSDLKYLNKEIRLPRLKDLDLSNVKGKKEIFIDLKFSGTFADSMITSNRLVQQCSEFLNHPAFQVNFIINNLSLASEMNALGYSIWADAYDFDSLNLNSTIYTGWFVRSADLKSDEVVNIISAGKSIILYEIYGPGGIKTALNKYPTGVLVEEVKEAVILSN